jgi:lysophospholipase L1-like esterase
MKRLWLMLLYGLLVLSSLSFAQDADDQWSVWSGSDGNDLEIYYTHYQGGQWTTPQKIFQDNAVHDVSPSIAVDDAGKPVVVWIRENEDKREVYCSRWDGEKWSPEDLVGDSSDIRLSQPSVTLDGEGNIWIVAAGLRNDDAQSEIYWTHRTSSGWSIWAQLNQEDASPDLDPTLLTFDKKILVVWCGFDGESYQLFERVWNEKGWAEEGRVFPAERMLGEFPSLTLRQGKPHLTFYQGEKILISHWEEQNWSSPISTEIPLEETFLNLWKNQGVSRIQSSWFTSKEDRGSLNILRQDHYNSSSTSTLVSKFKNFFKISGDEAWAAVNLNVYTGFGDSITGGFMGSSYIPFLNSRLNTQFGPSTVVNRGVGGERTTTGVNRIDSVLNADNPEFILIMEGINDAGDERFPEAIAFNLGVMVDKSIAFGTRPIISTITPRLDDHNGNVENTNTLIRGLAGSKGIPLADNYAAITAQPTAVFNTLFVDHLHYNDSGNDIIAQTWFNVINSAKGGGGDGGGGCGFVHPTSNNHWNINLEPLFFILLSLILVRVVRRVFQSR